MNVGPSAHRRSDDRCTDNTWRRHRQQLVVHPPRFVAMTDRDKQQVRDALAALLIDHLRGIENARRRP